MLDNFFKFNDLETNYKTEIIAGITTFLAMAYILGVNPVMLSETGMSMNGVFFATALSSGIACIVMGLISKYPIGLAPGMGLNALFTYTIVLEMGYSWNAALAAVFITSIIFFIITISGLRTSILNAMPNDLKIGISVGIGFFLAFIGLQSAGIIVSDPSTIVGLGGLLEAPVLLSIIGILISLVLYIKKVPAAIFIGLIITAIIGIIFTLFGYTGATMPVIPSEFVTTSFDTSVFAGFTSGFGELFSNIPNLIMIIFSMLFVTFFDATGTLISLGNQSGFADEEGNIKGIENAFIGDAIGGLIGSIVGTSTVTAFVESATGIGLGGRTGLTAIVTGICFILSIFISPIILSLFTSSVTVSALVIVGILMISQLRDINWDNLVVCASVFITILMMILTYSISIGIAWGFIVYAIGSIASGEYKKLNWLVWILVIVFALYLFFGL